MALLRRSLAPPRSVPWRPRFWRRLMFAAAVTAWLARLPWRVGRFCWLHRQGLVTVALVAGLYWLMGEVDTRPRQGVIGLLILACVCWVAWQPVLCEGRRPVLAAWRRLAVYRREWGPALTLAGLAHGARLPRLGRVQIDGALDVVSATMLPGQTADDWYSRRERLATVFGACSCRVFAVGGRSRQVLLEFVVPQRAQVPEEGEAW